MDNSVHIVGNTVPAPKRQAKPSAEVQIPLQKVKATSESVESAKLERPQAPAQHNVQPRSMSYAEISSMLSKVNIYLDQFEIQANYRIDKVTGGVHVEIVNSTSGEVLREIPPYEALEVLSNIESSTGLLINREG